MGSELNYHPPKDFVEVVHPARLAEDCCRCSLFWLPASSVPMPEMERRWFDEFLTRLDAALSPRFKTHMELFLLQQTVAERCLDSFLDRSLEVRPFPGLSRRPGSTLRGAVSPQELEDLQQNRRKFQAFDYMDPYCFWLRGGDRAKNRHEYFGLGGMTLAYLKGPPSPPQPAPRMPDFLVRDPRMQATLKNSSLEEQLIMSASLQSPFLAESKQKLLADLPQTLYVRSLGFALPQLRSSDFFTQREEYLSAVFSLFHCLILESPDDNGVLVASEQDLRPLIYEVRQTMREAERKDKAR